MLCIGMATYDDYDGVYFTVQAIRLYHAEVSDRIEILVVDNHPRGPCAGPLKDLERHIPGYRYVPYERSEGTAAREVVFREANAEYVLCVDSHVLFLPGALARLLQYLAAHGQAPDLWQGPLVGDDLTLHGTHFDPVWRAGMYGVWATDPRGLDPDGPPFEIVMQGLGVFGCRQEAWPGLNPRLRGFGGEEGYVHEKIRRAGGRTLCLPFLRWVHRFGRPFGPRYAVGLDDRVRNYLLVHDELGLDPAPAIEHFEQTFGAERVRPLVDRVERELRGPFHFFDAIYCINLDRDGDRWASVLSQARALGIDQRIRRFPAIDTPDEPRIGAALSHRAVIAEARWLGLDNVLILTDDVRFSRHTDGVLAQGLAEMAGRPWSLLYLDGQSQEGARPETAGGRHLRIARAFTGQHAVAYHHTVYDRVLAGLPATPTAMALWLDIHEGVGEYRARCLDGIGLAIFPPVAAGAGLLAEESPPFAPLPPGA